MPPLQSLIGGLTLIELCKILLSSMPDGSRVASYCSYGTIVRYSSYPYRVLYPGSLLATVATRVPGYPVPGTRVASYRVATRYICSYRSYR